MRYPALLVVLAWTVVGVLKAQVEIVYPTNHHQNVERAPAITIRAPAPIIQNSITRGYPDADPMGMISDKPTVMVIDTSYNNLPIQQRVKFSARGTYSFTDPRTLVFTPAHLVPGRTYRISVEGMWVQGAQPILLPTVESEFTVAAPTPKVSSCSIQSVPYISCADGITVLFNQPLERGLADAGRIILLERANAASSEEWVPVETSLSLVDNTVTITAAHGFSPGDLLRLSVELSSITGNPLDDRVYSTVVRKATTVHVEAVATDGREVPQNIAEVFQHMSTVALLGGTMELVAAEQYTDRWKLIGWQSPNQSLPSGTTSKLDLDCATLGSDVFVQAVLKRLDTVRVVVNADSMGVIKVFDKDNTLVRTITSNDTIVICDNLSQCSIVAEPRLGFRFVKWESPIPTIDENKAPVLELGKSIRELTTLDLYETDVSVSPEFEDDPPSNTTYRLRAVVYDTEESEGWSADDGISFTTNHEFEGTVPLNETICIKASNCWEITGYMVSGSYEWEIYDEPLQQACVTKAMTDPETVITFFVRRKLINLRLETALLNSDNVNDLLKPSNLSAETISTVQLRTYDGNRTVWKYLVSKACYDENIRFSTYSLQCGDEVRVTFNNSPTRCQQFVWFDPLQNYVVPRLDNDKEASPTCSIIIDENSADFESTSCKGFPLYAPEMRVRSCYRQGFGLEAIGVTVRVLEGSDRSTAKFVERWFDPNTFRILSEDEPASGRHIEYVPAEGAIVKLKFTAPVDQRTIVDGAIEISSYDNTLYSEPDNDQLDFSAVSTYDNISFESGPFESARTVVLSIKKPGTTPLLQALHGGSFKITIDKALASLTGIAIESRSSYLFQSVELPAYSLRLHEVEFEYDGDADFILEFDGEVYHALYGGDIGDKNVYSIDQAFARLPNCAEQQGVPPGECTLPHSDKDGPQGYGDMLLWIQPNWMGRTDIAWWHAATYDEDCKDEDDCLVNRVADLLGLAKEEAKKIVAKETKSDLYGALAELGVGFIQALLPADEQDENIGYGTFLVSGDEMWGARRSTKYYEIGNENATYRLIPRLLVSRAVVR